MWSSVGHMETLNVNINLKNLDLIKHWINRGLCREGSDINYYQNECRFYLDEHASQQELRKEWFKALKITKLINLPFITKKSIPYLNLSEIKYIKLLSAEAEKSCNEYFDWLEKRFNERN